jgi:cytidylate kinase
VSAAIAESKVESGFAGKEAYLRIDGFDPKPHLREENVNRAVSPVSVIPAVRECLTGHLRKLAEQRDVVVVGRDIGSVVFPDTPFKFYIDASQKVRQQRRNAEGQDDEIALRDRIDSSRAHAPLTVARGAIVIDSTHLSVQRVVDEMIRQLDAKGLAILRR